MKKRVVFLLLALLLALTALPASAHRTTVLDTDGLLSGEESALLGVPCDCENAYGLGYYIVLLSDRPFQLHDGEIFSLAGITSESDAIVLVIRESGTYYYDIYTYGFADELFSDADIDLILDDPDVYGSIKAGSLHKGAAAFTALASDIANEHYAAEQARAARAPLMALLCGVITGAIAGGVSVLCVFLTYRKKRHGASYPLSRYASLTLTDSRDIFAGSFVTRTRIQSSGGGSRSGSRPGGGHRGGR